MRSRHALLSLAMLAAVTTVAACGDEGPASGPGTVTAVVASPNGDEGAAVLTLSGTGIGEITAVSGEVFSRPEGSDVTVVIINESAGELAFRIALADTTQKPAATLVEVAAPDDDLRTTLAGYEVEYRR